MRILAYLLLAVFLALNPDPLITMTAEQDTQTGRYYMVITGVQSEIERVCAQDDCNRTFETRLEATNYFLELLGKANGLKLTPIPPPTTLLQHSAQTSLEVASPS